MRLIRPSYLHREGEESGDRWALQFGHQLLEYHVVPLPSTPLPAPGDSLCPQEKLMGTSLKVSFLLL